MIRSELVARIAKQNPHLYTKEVEAAVTTILNTMAGALTRGDRVELRDFGSFATKEVAERAARNPRTGTVVTATAKRVVQFKLGKGMRDRLNREKAHPEQEAEQRLRGELRSAAAAWPAR